MYDHLRAKTENFSFTEPRALTPIEAAYLPAFAKTVLAANAAYSRRFTDEQPERQAWKKNHRFELNAHDCIDGRRVCAEEAWGERNGETGFAPLATIKIERSSGSISGLESPGTTWTRMKRAERGRPIMLAETIHYSSSHPQASCAALGNDTAAGKRIAGYKAQEANYAFQGRVFAFPVYANTDYSSVKIIGPMGTIDTAAIAHDCLLPSKERLAMIEKALREIFPSGYSQLAALGEDDARLFPIELAQYVNANVEYVKKQLAANRQPKITHDERGVIIGRHVAPLAGLNAFVCDNQSSRFKYDQRIALTHVTRNAVADALREGDREWVVPVVIDARYDDPEDQRIQQVHVSGLRPLVESVFAAWAEKIRDFIIDDPHGVPGADKIEWLSRDLRHLPGRLSICTTTTNRADRLMVPFV